MAFAGSVIVLTASGVATGLSYGIVSGDLGVAPRILGGALVYVPAMWLLIGLSVAIVGLAPRAVVAAWAVLGACIVIGMLGELLDLPGWMKSISPFGHVPQLPVADLTVLPLVALTTVAAVLTAAGLAGLRRRDIG